MNDKLASLEDMTGIVDHQLGEWRTFALEAHTEAVSLSAGEGYSEHRKVRKLCICHLATYKNLTSKCVIADTECLGVP